MPGMPVGHQPGLKPRSFLLAELFRFDSMPFDAPRERLGSELMNCGRLHFMVQTQEEDARVLGDLMFALLA